MRTILIGIAGGTGSGKTTLARKLVEALPAGETLLLQHDDYYRDRSHLSPAERDVINFDEPDALENARLAADLTALRTGKSVEAPLYDFATHTRRAETRPLEPRPIVIVDGILLFAVPELRDLFDLRIFVDTADDLRLMRRIKRDLLERGRDLASVEAQYFGTVRAMHAQHVAPSKGCAHLVIDEESGSLEAVVDQIVAMTTRAGA